MFPTYIVFIEFKPHHFFVPLALPVFFIFDTYVRGLANAACPISVHFFKLSGPSNLTHFWPYVFISDNMLWRLTRLWIKECKRCHLSDEFFHLMGHQCIILLPWTPVCGFVFSWNESAFKNQCGNFLSLFNVFWTQVLTLEYSGSQW